METYIPVQAAEIAASLALGLLLAFIYDLLRLPRRIFPGAAWLFDFAFCLVLAAGLFLLGMVCGATLRFYMPFAAAASALGWNALTGRHTGKILAELERLFEQKREKMKIRCKKLNKNLKNIFSRLEKRFRIIGYTENDNVGKSVGKSGARRARRKGTQDEISTQGNTGKNYYPGHTDICSFDDG